MMRCGDGWQEEEKLLKTTLFGKRKELLASTCFDSLEMCISTCVGM